MQITFLVGNGFDIRVGMKSSYRDFYNWYIKQPSSLPYIEQMKKDIEDDLKTGSENWSDFERGLGKFTEHFKKETVDAFFLCYDDAQMKLLEYLSEETKRFVSSLSAEKIDKFRQGIIGYQSELSPKEKQVLQSVYPDKGNYDINVRFLSFNYTHWLDTFVKEASKTPLRTWAYSGNQRKMVLSPSVIHIHGTLDHLPVFGVNDETQIANKELLESSILKSILVKQNNIRDNGELWHEDAEQAIKNSNIICVFGMSMGITDSIWFERIMDWLKASGDRHVILFWHTSDPSNLQSSLKRATNREKAKKGLTDYSGLQNNAVEAINERIHVIENSKVLFDVKLEEQAVAIDIGA